MNGERVENESEEDESEDGEESDEEEEQPPRDGSVGVTQETSSSEPTSQVGA